MGMKQKKKNFEKNKKTVADKKKEIFKTSNSQNIFVKISWIGP